MRAALVAAALIAAPTAAAADRDPWDAGTMPQTHARPGGRVRSCAIAASIRARPSAPGRTTDHWTW